MTGSQWAIGSFAGRALGGAFAPHTVLLATTSVLKFTPNVNALPGGSALLSLINGIGGWALMLSLAGLVVGAALWALGSHSQNYQHSYVGRRVVLVSAAAALLIGVAPVLIKFFFDTGQGIPNPLG